MPKRPFAFPRPQFVPCGFCFRQVPAFAEIPQHHQRLAQPNRRRQLLDALLAPMLRLLNFHDLFATFEQSFNRVPQGVRLHNPTRVRIQVGCIEAQVVIALIQRAAEDDLNYALAKYFGPGRLKATHVELPHFTIGKNFDAVPIPGILRRFGTVRLFDRLARRGQPLSVFAVGAGLSRLASRNLWSINRGIAAHQTDVADLFV